MIAFCNGKIVTPTGVLENHILTVQENRIHAILANDSEAHADWEWIDAQGGYLLPGFIDTHSDKIEQYIQPRPTSRMEMELAIRECERKLLQLGITTMYHSLSLFKDEFFGKAPLRTKESVRKVAEALYDLNRKSHMIHHRFHLRLEIDNFEAFAIAQDLMERNLVHLISFMDHTPGQGQYRNLGIYEKTISKYNGKELQELGFDGVLEYHKNKTMMSFSQLQELTRLAHAKGIAVASHDDDTIEKLQINQAIGVDISEFPVTLETAQAAVRMGFKTVVGAPNILLGGSHSGNMSAADAILQDCADILCSDYYPSAILHGIFKMHFEHEIPLYVMVAKATLNPAEALGIAKDYGSLEAGKKADLLVIQIEEGFPQISHVFVDGIECGRFRYRLQEA